MGPSVVARFPDREDAQQAQALAWLLPQSQDGPTIDAAVQAIAGLPINPPVQDQLLCRQTVDTLSKILTTEPSTDIIDKSKPDLFGACLYALLHLVQCAPANMDDEDGPAALRALVATGGALYNLGVIRNDLRSIALCVKCRIILLLCDEQTRDANPTLFDVDIPVHINSCTDDHLRRLLYQVRFLARNSSSSHAPSKYLAALKDRGVPDRDKVHAQLSSRGSNYGYIHRSLI
jgi:hypothetical protein